MILQILKQSLKNDLLNKYISSQLDNINCKSVNDFSYSIFMPRMTKISLSILKLDLYRRGFKVRKVKALH